MPKEEAERRDHERQPIELKVEYKRLNAFFADYTKNISKGGTFIQTNKPLDVGTEFVFLLLVPTLDEPIKIHGEVIRVDRGDRGETPGMGIQFLYRGDDERRGIEEMVERLMVDSLGELVTAKLMARSRAASEGGE